MAGDEAVEPLAHRVASAPRKGADAASVVGGEVGGDEGSALCRALDEHDGREMPATMRLRRTKLPLSA
jgi:hypothetical protein